MAHFEITPRQARERQRQGALLVDIRQAHERASGQAEGALVKAIVAEARPGDHVLVMSNGSFGGIHGKLLDALTVVE